MKNHYQTLQISEESTTNGIKKAYFKLVREYPPDRYPDQFMKIREAYEVLINENSRQEYDSLNSLPPVVKLYYQGGLQAMESEDPEEAIKCLKVISRVYSKYSIINSLLGDAYLENGNSGKAIRIFEKLVAQEPGNASYIRRLAHSYSMRGWHHKAVERYQEALELDEDNLSLWLGLIASYMETDDIASATKTLKEGLAVSNKKGWDNLTLYFQIIVIDLVTENHEELKQHLQDLKSKALTDENNKTNTAWFLALLANKLNSAGLPEMAINAVENAATLLPEDPEIASITAEISKQSTIDLKMDELIDDPAIDNDLARLLDFALNRCEDASCIECQFKEFDLEMEIIMNLDAIRSDLVKLKNRYPELYRIKADFFDSAANRKKEKYLLDTYFKKLSYFQKKLPEAFELDEDDLKDEAGNPLDVTYGEPYTRSDPKVGRNEPCPCGSGKKYKKCCGK